MFTLRFKKYNDIVIYSLLSLKERERGDILEKDEYGPKRGTRMGDALGGGVPHGRGRQRQGIEDLR